MKLRILVLDDDVKIRELLQTALSSKGHDVKTLTDPTEFPFVMRENCPCEPGNNCADVLIADIVMPNMDGIDFYKKLTVSGCQPLKNSNVAIMSGYLTIHYMNELNKLNIQYFRKPFQLSELYEWIEECEARIGAAEKAQQQH